MQINQIKLLYAKWEEIIISGEIEGPKQQLNQGGGQRCKTFRAEGLDRRFTHFNL